MLGVLFNTKVTVRRAQVGGRTARNAVTYEQLVDSTGFPLTLKCRLERRGRRIFSTTGHEKESDAQMVWRDTATVEIKDEDLIVTTKGETFKVMSVERQTKLGTAVGYGRAQLRRTEIPVPGDKHGS
jgi:hypothetical protein